MVFGLGVSRSGGGLQSSTRKNYSAKKYEKVSFERQEIRSCKGSYENIAVRANSPGNSLFTPNRHLNLQTFIHFQQLTTHRFNAIMNKNIKAMTKIGKESVGIQRAGQGESRL